MKKSLLVFLVLSIIPALLQAETGKIPSGFEQARQNMVIKQLRNRDISDKKVLAAMSRVPRHVFVPKRFLPLAYADRPLPIGYGQTISQPYVVALMTEHLELKGNEKVLEIGTGSGYQAAVLSQLTNRVFTIEIKEKLYKKTDQLLEKTGYASIKTRHGDGYFGWKEHAPFDCIMITASVDHIPPPLLQQLKDGGKLILPLGNPLHYQNLVLVTKHGEDYTVKQITGVLFVPMTGRALERKK